MLKSKELRKTMKNLRKTINTEKNNYRKEYGILKWYLLSNHYLDEQAEQSITCYYWRLKSKYISFN